MVREQNLLHMYSLILDIRETANFDFPFPHASSYQAKSNLVLGDSQNAVMSTTVSSEACLLQGRLGEWVRESSQSNNNKFNDRGVRRNKFCSTEAGHIKAMMYCTLRMMVQSVKMTASLNMASPIQK